MKKMADHKYAIVVAEQLHVVNPRTKEKERYYSTQWSVVKTFGTEKGAQRHADRLQREGKFASVVPLTALDVSLHETSTFLRRAKNDERWK